MHELPYSAREELYGGARTILLRDEIRDQQARILMYAGNNLMEFNVRGLEYMHFPETPEAFARSANLSGNPFLHPWPNRLRGDFYHFAGARHELTGEIYRDGNGLPLHGMVLKSNAWEPVWLEVNEQGAAYTARLVWETVPGGPANFPFPHTAEIIHQLRDGVLRVRTMIHNTGTQTMPACFGHHPYFAVTPGGRTRLDIPVHEFMELNSSLLPTGATRPVKEISDRMRDFDPDGTPLDHIFTGLRREGDDGFAWFTIKSGERDLRIGFDEHYPIAVIYAPEGRPFVCVEPMTAPTDALNLNHDGLWNRVPLVEPGSTFLADFIMQPAQ